jgi:hypothetical protein
MCIARPSAVEDCVLLDDFATGGCEGRGIALLPKGEWVLLLEWSIISLTIIPPATAVPAASIPSNSPHSNPAITIGKCPVGSTILTGLLPQ